MNNPLIIFIYYIFKQFDWVFELHQFIFPDAWKNNNVYCVKCSCNFFFDKENINRTVELKSGRIAFELSCPICSCSCYKFKDNLNED
jgi:hypothetical protein